MSESQTIAEINRIITALPKSKLDEFLSVLQRLEKIYKVESSNQDIVNKIFVEDRNLLEELAK